MTEVIKPDPKPDTKPEVIKPDPKPNTKPTSPFAAIVFDPSKEKQRNSVLSFFAKLLSAKQTPSPSPSSLIITQMPVLNEEGQYQSAGDPLVLRIGANVGIESNAVFALIHSNNSIVKKYLDSGCFKIFQPMEGREGLCYADYNEDDAIELVSATLALSFLDEWIEGEDRYQVKRMYEAVSTEISQQLADRQDS
jgi:hypothetical protein